MSRSGKVPRISIITVVRNGASDLAQTIASVRAHHYDNLEYLVIDGASTDGTLDVIRANEDIISSWLSEPDAGIYDAMNKGIARATGDYLLFLNARDELVVDLNALVPVLTEGFVMVYGKANMIREDGTLSYVKGKPLKSANKLLRGTPLCHQAILYRKSAIGRYDTRYRIIADRVLTYELVKRHGLASSCFVDMAIARYHEGGYSRQNQLNWQREEYQFLRAAGRHVYAEYKRLGWWYKLWIKQPLARLRKGHGRI